MNSTLIAVIAGILAFWAVMYALFGKKEIDPVTGEPIEKEEGLTVDLFIAMWRTKRLLGFIDRVSRLNPRLWKVYSDIGIVLGYIGMVYVFYALFKTAMKALQTHGSQAGVQLVIPGVTIPLWYGLVGLAVVMIVHELSHGVVARADGLPLKSVGVLLLAILPGAFVEPDEEALEKASLRSRLRVYGAGSLANIVTALVAILIINLAITPVLQPSGILVSGVVKDGPSYGILHTGDVIKSIDGQNIKTMDDFVKFMNSTKPGETISLVVLRDGKEVNVKLTLGKRPDKPHEGYMGVYIEQYVVSRIGYSSVILPLFFSLYWIYFLNLGIGLMNLFPLVPLDGGKMLDDILKEYLPEGIARPMRYLAVGVGLVLLILNFIPALLKLAT